MKNEGLVADLNDGVVLMLMLVRPPSKGYLGLHQRGVSESRASKRHSLGTLTQWIMAALMFAGSPAVEKCSRALPFVFPAAITLAQFFVVLLAYPETKGVSLEELQKKLSVA